jgi:hypothetical protein
VRASAFVLGGNASTLAFVTALGSQNKTITAHLVPLAQTPLGTVAGETWQNVQIATPNLPDWIDSTFPPGDERAFIAPLRDIELLARIEWQADPPAHLNDEAILNIEDVPDDVAEALAHPPEPLVQCAACRRLCVRDHFVWKERRLCAWHYHQQVFGKRGPWHSGPYEERHFESLASPAYVAPPLLDEAGVEVVMAVAGVDDAIAQRTINTLLENDAQSAYMAVRTPDGYTLLREK